MDRRYDVLTDAARLGRAFVEGLADRPVGATSASSSVAPARRGASRWHGATVMRISVSGWQTTAADADRSADAVLAALRAVLTTG